MRFKEFLEQNTVGQHNDYATGAVIYDQGPTHEGSGKQQTLGNFYLTAEPHNIQGTVVNIMPRKSHNTTIQRTQTVYIKDNKGGKIFRIILSREELERWNKLGCYPEVGKAVSIIMNRDGKIQSVRG